MEAAVAYNLIIEMTYITFATFFFFLLTWTDSGTLCKENMEGGEYLQVKDYGVSSWKMVTP